MYHKSNRNVLTPFYALNSIYIRPISFNSTPYFYYKIRHTLATFRKRLGNVYVLRNHVWFTNGTHITTLVILHQATKVREDKL